MAITISGDVPNFSTATITTGTVTTLTSTTISDGTNSTSSTNCIQGSAKAWANFNGTSGVSIRASYNISSITRNTTGSYTVNFTNAFADANYAVCGGVAYQSGFATNQIFEVNGTGSITSSSFQFYVAVPNQAVVDANYIYFSIFR
jgi:hypothetical protein